VNDVCLTGLSENGEAKLEASFGRTLSASRKLAVCDDIHSWIIRTLYKIYIIFIDLNWKIIIPEDSAIQWIYSIFMSSSKRTPDKNEITKTHVSKMQICSANVKQLIVASQM